MELFRNLLLFNVSSFALDSMDFLNVAAKLCGNILLIFLFYYQLKKHKKDANCQNNNRSN